MIMEPLFDILARQISPHTNRVRRILGGITGRFVNWLIIGLILIMALFWFVMFLSTSLVFNHTYQDIMVVPFFASMIASVVGIIRFFIMPKTRLIILCFALGIFGICLNLFGCLWITGATINAFM